MSCTYLFTSMVDKGEDWCCLIYITSFPPMVIDVITWVPKFSIKLPEKRKKLKIRKKFYRHYHLQECGGFPPCQGWRIPSSWNSPLDVFLQHQWGFCKLKFCKWNIKSVSGKALCCCGVNLLKTSEAECTIKTTRWVTFRKTILLIEIIYHLQVYDYEYIDQYGCNSSEANT